MALSARNHLKGEITEVILGTVTALITVEGRRQYRRVRNYREKRGRTRPEERRQGDRGD